MPLPFAKDLEDLARVGVECENVAADRSHWTQLAAVQFAKPRGSN